MLPDCKVEIVYSAIACDVAACERCFFGRPGSTLPYQKVAAADVAVSVKIGHRVKGGYAS